MIKIYGNSRCIFCVKAKLLAEQFRLDFEFKDTDNDECLNEMKNLKPDAKSIPQIWWNGNYIGGYDDFQREIENTRNFGQEAF
jgi:glutaredoxin 3